MKNPSGRVKPLSLSTLGLGPCRSLYNSETWCSKNFKANIDGIDIHFIYEKGSGANPKPLLLNHGWPGSIIEFLDIIDQLAHPEKYGGNIENAFDVVLPSLPGYGFSDRPSRPIGPRIIARIFWR